MKRKQISACGGRSFGKERIFLFRCLLFFYSFIGGKGKIGEKGKGEFLISSRVEFWNICFEGCYIDLKFYSLFNAFPILFVAIKLIKRQKG